MRKNDQGFTLIELVVVIIIISLLAGGATLGIQSLDSGNARSTVKRVDALLDYVRVLNMTKEYTYNLHIEGDGNQFSATVQSISGSSITPVLTENFKLKNGDITYQGVNGGLPTPTYSVITDPFNLTFDKASGSIDATSQGQITEINIRSGSRHYRIILVTATGKHYIED